MSIKRSRRWWKGTSSADIDTYLAEFCAQNYPIGRVVHARCGNCGGTVFGLQLDDEEGCVRRTCRSCGVSAFMLDSAEYAEDAELGDAACPCGGESFDTAVGFSLLDDGEVRWVYVGLRCTKDGVLGVYADWKIDYVPSTGLFAAV